MNILLVDDDSYVLEALRKTLDWEALGIVNVYTAHSVNKARKIIEDIPIQILICDIEMPKENGFELLKWIRQKQYIIKDILLTSYAEFKYATEAIKFGCYAYALKPIDYNELEKLIMGAVIEEKRALSLVNHQKYYEYWTSSLRMRKEQFFWNFLLNNKENEQGKYDLLYKNEERFLPIIIQYTLGYSYLNTDNEKGMFDWTINNLISEVYTTDNGTVEAVLHLKKDEILIIMHLDNMMKFNENIVKLSETFTKKIYKNLELSCSVVVGKESKLGHLKTEVTTFLAYMKKKLIEYGEVIILNNYDIQKANYNSPDFTIWENFLKSGQEQAVKKEVFKYLDRQYSVNNLDKDVLKRLITNFIQLLISVLNENGINTYQIGDSLFNTDLVNFSIQNVTNAKKGIDQMIDTTINMIKSPEKDKPIVQTVMEYIDNNLDKDLTREALADHVYLNQDYLARIFKKEIGESIGNYITEKRVTVAKKYLEKTNESVNSIAIKVGYDNFSYFTKIFKDRVGMTPKDYRRIYGLTENFVIEQ